MIGISKQRISRERRRTLWIKTDTRLSRGAAFWATLCRRSSPWKISTKEVHPRRAMCKVFIVYSYLRVPGDVGRIWLGFASCPKNHAGGCVRTERFTEGHFLNSPVDVRISNHKVHPIIKSMEREMEGSIEMK